MNIICIKATVRLNFERLLPSPFLDRKQPIVYKIDRIGEDLYKVKATVSGFTQAAQKEIFAALNQIADEYEAHHLSLLETQSA